MQEKITPAFMQSALQERYATKIFDANKQIDDETWQAIKDSLVFAPSAFGLQPWKFIAINNKSLRTTLKSVSWDQAQVTDASRYVVLAVKKELDEAFLRANVARMAEVRNMPLESLDAFYTMLHTNLVDGKTVEDQTRWSERQTYIALGFAGLAAATMGVDTCMLEGLDARAYDTILELEGSGYQTLGAIAFGYRGEGDKYATLPKVRFEESVVFENRD